MSLTGAFDVFASVSEAGVNTFFKAIFTTRPHYLNFGSSLFVPSTTVDATNMDAIAFPGIPGGVQWAVGFTVPEIFLFPDSSGAAALLPPVANGFTVATKVRIVLGCMTWSSGPVDKGGGSVTPVSTELEVLAQGEVSTVSVGPGTGSIIFTVSNVLLPNIAPASLEAVLSCLIRMLLSAALENVRIPFTQLSLDALTLTLQQGPTIEDEQIEIWGTL